VNTLKKGFFNGLLAGGLIGAFLTMFMSPQKKKETKQFLRNSKQVKKGARRVIKGVKNMAEDWMK
jgi:gas vesicle protein